VASFPYRPHRCKQTYRMVVVRKNLSVSRGDEVLFDDVRYFFYLTNDRQSSADQIVRSANHRCNQENLIEQLKGEVRALRMPLDNLVSNWAYMVITSLAWTLKAWFALLLPTTGRWKDKHAQEREWVLRMEFKRFVHGFMRLPCQVIRTGRRIVYRLLGWNPWLHVLLRGLDALMSGNVQRSRPMRC